MFQPLVSCFEPYDEFPANASQLAMERARQTRLPGIDVRWRTYPVDFDEAPRQLGEDLQRGCDAALLLGQAPGSRELRLETRGANIRYGPHDAAPGPLVEHGDDEYHSELPIGLWAERLRQEGLPAVISHDAGSYLCNALLYHCLRAAATASRPLHALFLHVPLTPSQGKPSLPVEQAAAAIVRLLQWMRETADERPQRQR